MINTERLDADGLAWLKREFRVIAGLRHPQIAVAYDFGYTESGHLPFYTREYVEGESLAAGPPGLGGQADPQQFLQPLIDLLDALHYLHDHEILHLDVHAGNLIVPRTASRGAVLIDFGLLRRDLGSLASSSSVDARQASRPPELLRGEDVGPQTDVYAVGRLLLYRLTGKYLGESKLPREIPGWGPRLTLELERIAAKALESAPEHRFQSALEFRAALLDCLGQRQGRVAAAEPGELTVGRERELELVDAALEGAVEGRTPVVWFVGPAGIGKSRLLTEARWRAQLRGLCVADVHFVPRAASLAATLRSIRGEGAGEPAPSWLSPLSREHGGSTRERAAKAAQSYFSAVGDPPLVLLLDDLESADRESLFLAEALLSECVGRQVDPMRRRGLAIVVADTAGPRRSKPAASAPCAVHRLRPLSRPQAVELLERLLRPLSAPRRLLETSARQSRGYPLRLRQLAHSLHSDFGSAGRIPDGAEAPVLPPTGSATDLEGKDADQLRVLEVLAVIQRPTDRHELATGCGLALRDVTKALRKLTRAELVASTVERPSRARLYYVTDPGTVAQIVARVSAKERSRIHGRVVDALRACQRPTLRQRECLGRHLLAAGKQRQGREAALEIARLLCERGQQARALRLLEDTATTETNRRSRLIIAEWISDLYGAEGDHFEAIAALEPVFKEIEAGLKNEQTVRICRRLGVHYHRAGHPRRAASLFGKALELARDGRDREELVFVHSELAELHTFQGDYEKAENACRAGLDLLEGFDTVAGEFRGDMEVTLRATLGHLELRRLNLERSRAEFEKALELTHSHGTVGLRALILNNLGIVYNQLDEYPRARRCFQTAERLLEAAGERHALIHIACNLAVMAAKEGAESRARTELEKANRHLRDHPGERLEFFLAVSRAVTEHHFGSMESAAEGFLTALPLGRKFGDTYLVSFAELYLAETQIACGRYLDALKLLRGIASRARRCGPPILRRMTAARLLLAGRLLGDESVVKRASRTLEDVPRTTIVLLEAWNDLCLAVCAYLGAASRASPSAVESAPVFEDVQQVFRRLGVVAGARLARLGPLGRAIRAGNTDDVRSLLNEIERSHSTTHRFVRVVEPLVSAEACFLLGDLDRCGQHLQKASTAMVGSPFLELDWRIEFQRARLAERQGDREGARHHLHRSLQARDFLVRTLPAQWRRKLLDHERFRPLDEYRSRLERIERTRSTPLRVGAREYHGMVGASRAMRSVFERIEQIEDLDAPVLIRGETGTGKELVARAIHRSGPRRQGAFHSLHCASLPAELFESELFGYEAGAFTGADESRTGLLEHLAGGTLLLDEITHLSPRTQSKLLQVLDTRIARPVGSLSVRPVDLRFLASTSADIDAAISRGELREDLYYRLRGVEIGLPPLRSRLEDLPALTNHFLTLHGRRLERTPPSLSPRALLALGEHDWPGNVRELEALMIRLLVTTSPASTIDARTLRELLTPRQPRQLFADDLLEGRELRDLRRELEKAYLLRLFRKTRGDINKMAAALGVKRSNLYTWFRRVGIDVRELRR